MADSLFNYPYKPKILYSSPAWLESYLRSDREKRLTEELNLKLEENIAAMNYQRHINSVKPPGYIIVENRMLKKGQAFEIDGKIHIECIYPLVFTMSMTFEEKLDFCFDNARRNIAREIEAIMRKYTRA